ncbi:MAG: hypothetical protein K2H17_07350 [Duncaniella sp.]|uniref:hypothetical protein n=1 Tax=Duncaniella sp. TaxID=2518496 RepID=UPI0023BCE185|nr:hypothetical protein [Duncaniella sp.]MDE5989197.1 hypothetical protein [Duncaniella sp.]
MCPDAVGLKVLRCCIEPMLHHFMSAVSRGYYVGKQVFGLPAKIVVSIFAGKFQKLHRRRDRRAVFPCPIERVGRLYKFLLFTTKPMRTSDKDDHC